MKAKMGALVDLCLEVTQNLAQFTVILFLSGTRGLAGVRGCGQGGQLDSPEEGAVARREG